MAGGRFLMGYELLFKRPICTGYSIQYRARIPAGYSIPGSEKSLLSFK